MKRCYVVLGLFLLCLIVACTGPRSSVDEGPDNQYGHRFEERAPDGRRTITLAAPTADGSYMYLPATFESIVVRPAPATDVNDEVRVEVLVKGALPDACMELHKFDQERAGNLIEAALEMRRPQNTVCMSVWRPYRVYLMLDGSYGVGSYTLKINGVAAPFEIRVTN